MEEDIKILEEMLNEVYSDLKGVKGESIFKLSNEKRQAIKNLIKGYRELKKKLKEEKIWRIRLEKENEDTCNEVNANYIRKSIVVPKYEIEKLKKENEININKMRPYKHQCPFDFGVLNGIDECCRKLLEDK